MRKHDKELITLTTTPASIKFLPDSILLQRSTTTIRRKEGHSIKISLHCESLLISILSVYVSVPFDHVSQAGPVHSNLPILAYTGRKRFRFSFILVTVLYHNGGFGSFMCRYSWSRKYCYRREATKATSSPGARMTKSVIPPVKPETGHVNKTCNLDGNKTRTRTDHTVDQRTVLVVVNDVPCRQVLFDRRSLKCLLKV